MTDQKETDTTQELLHCILDIGELLLTGGGEIMRVEDTISRLCYAYGFQKPNVFTITSSIVVTVRTERGQILTQTRRISRQRIDLDQVDRVNSLSRRLCREQLPLDALRAEIKGIREQAPFPDAVQMLVYAVVSAAFCLFFGGAWLDTAAAFLSGGFLFLCIKLTGRFPMNDIINCMLASFLTGLSVVVLHYVGFAPNPDKVSIGNIMLLIPGLLFTVSIRDMINGDTLSGLLGICQAVLKAAAVAIGFAVVVLLTGGASCGM